MSSRIRYEQIKEALAKRVLRDQVVPAGMIRLLSYEKGIYVGKIGNEQMVFADWAADQYLQHIGFAPTRVFHKGMRIAPEETLALVDRFRDYSRDKQLLVRIEYREKPIIRAVASHRFTTLDDHELLEVVEEALSPYEWSPGWCWRSGTISYYTFILEGISEEVRPGDAIKAGIRVVNSETGHHSLDLRGYLFRLICSNGAVAPAEVVGRFRKYHVGLKTEEMKKLLYDQLTKMIEKLDQYFVLVRKATEIEIPDVEEAFEELRQRYRLSKKLLGKVIEAYKIEPGNTLYHIANAFTYVATHDQEISNNTKVLLEEIGGNLLVRARPIVR